jgi:hypothetical protein
LVVAKAGIDLHDVLFQAKAHSIFGCTSIFAQTIKNYFDLEQKYNLNKSTIMIK